VGLEGRIIVSTGERKRVIRAMGEGSWEHAQRTGTW